MAYNFDGVDDVMRFSIGAFSAADAGPLTIAVLIDFDATNDGALVHMLTSGNASCAFLECFGGTVNYGTGATARALTTASAADGWTVLVGRKADGSATPRYTKTILGGSPAHGDSAGGAMTDGSTPGAGGVIQLGRFQTSGTEYTAGSYAAAAMWTSVLSDGDCDTLDDSWNAWLALSPQWAVEFTESSSRTDASGNGGNETSRTGTTLVADPAGFFTSAAATPPPLIVPTAAAIRSSTW